MINTLLKISENTQRILIILFIGLIALFLLVGLISQIVKKIMAAQGTKADEMLKNVVEANYFKSEKKLIRFGIKKNVRAFYKEARIPFFIMAGAWLLLLIYLVITGKWGYNVFNTVDGFGTIVIDLDWPKEKFFFIKIVNDWPTVARAPKFVAAAWVSYIFVPVNAVGIVWFLLCTQAYIARSFRIVKIARSIFRKKLVPEQAPTPIQNDQNSII